MLFLQARVQSGKQNCKAVYESRTNLNEKGCLKPIRRAPKHTQRDLEDTLYEDGGEKRENFFTAPSLRFYGPRMLCLKAHFLGKQRWQSAL